MAARQLGLTSFLMSSVSLLPASFPPTLKGYNQYLKALGINTKDQTTILFGAISFAKFQTIDRRTLDEKIQEAASECERLHDVYIDAIKDGRETDAAFADAGWTRRSKEFNSLLNLKYGIQ